MRVRNIARAFVASALLLGPAIATAQTMDRDRPGIDREDRGGFDLGWLGLLGLAGLVGLKGRDKVAEGYKSPAAPVTTASGRL